MPDTKGGEKKPIKDMMPQAPEGFKAVEITVGVVGEDYTQVISGLKQGDMIYSETITSDTDTFSKMMGAMGGMSGGPGGMGGMSGTPGGMSSHGGMGGR